MREKFNAESDKSYANYIVQFLRQLNIDSENRDLNTREVREGLEAYDELMSIWSGNMAMSDSVKAEFSDFVDRLRTAREEYSQ